MLSITLLENAVTAMGTEDGWVSDVYNILSEKFSDRKAALEYAISYLKAYEAIIASAAEKAETLSTAISNACASE